MRDKLRATVLAFLSVMAVLAVSTPATAHGAYFSSRQLTPGITTRVVWDTARVACYRLPDAVDHLGPLHVELAFKPASADMDLYLLDAQGRQVGGLLGEQGTLGSLLGREVVDFRVDQIGDPGTPDPLPLAGDTYYVLAVAFTDTAKVRITGYYPQIDLGAGGAVDGADNYSLKPFSFPRDPSSWLTLTGPSSGAPYLFRPTSVGQGTCRLEWPADVEARQIVYDPYGSPQPARMGQYLYAGPSWIPVVENEGAWAPPAQDGWWGLLDGFAVGPGALAQPQVDVHYVPNLYAVASDPVLGAAAPPQTGLLTRGFKATLTYPENLRIFSVTRSGDERVVSGTFALGGSYVGGARVTLQRKTNAGWVSVKSVLTGPTGTWAAKIRVTTTTKVRARAPGDPSTGLPLEYSVVRTIRG